MATYIELFLNINKYIYDNCGNKRNFEPFSPVSTHCDFEIWLKGAIKQIWSNSQLKLCFGIYIEI